MDTTTTTGRVRRSLLLSFVVAILSLSLITQTANPAAADGGISGATALAIGETLAGPVEAAGGGSGTVAVAGACVASVLCAVITGGAFLAGGLYLTRDAWLPTLKDMWSKAFGSGGASAAPNCVITLAAPVVNGTAGQFAVTGTSANPAGCASGSAVELTNYTCRNATTGAASQATGPLYTNVAFGSGARTYSIPSVCGASELVGGRMRGVVGDFVPGCYCTAYLPFGTQIPADQVSQTSTVVCQKADGSTGTITKSHTGDGLLVPSCQQEWAGSWPKSFTASAGWPGAEQPVITATMPNTATQYPDCFGSAGEYLNTCRVRVWINGAPCAIGVSICTNWQQYEQDHPGASVQCKWGPYVVGMGNCTLLKNSYKPDAATQVITTVDPVTSTPADPGTITSPSIPETGTNPATPGTTVGSGTDADTAACFGSGWSWNPVSWVLVPVKCALKWAFVPPAAPGFADVPSPLPAGWLPSLPALSDGSCGAVTMPELSMGFHGGHFGPVTMFNTCNAPWPLVRTFTYNGMLALVLVSVCRAAFRAVMNALGMGVEAVGGGDD
jgi:hypothetical protein